MKNTEELKEGLTRNALMASMSQGIASLFRNSTLQPKNNKDRFE
jgi:hypothetical protein